MKPLVPNGTACLKFLKRKEKREKKRRREKSGKPASVDQDSKL
jgi:hypothetical protein